MYYQFYCAQTNPTAHFLSGMSGVINPPPPETEETFHFYQIGASSLTALPKVFPITFSNTLTNPPR